jgi:predicted DNA repair protein MutK
MASGLSALLDDIATIAKVAAASIDDIGAAAGKAGTKAAGVVIDDTAVTPRYVTGFKPDRELPVIARIAAGSLFNKIVIILPAALLLSYFLPSVITPILMLGASYLCFEGAEKVLEVLHPKKESLHEKVVELTSAEHEKEMVKGAVRTDFILSTEIMVIALKEVSELGIAMQAAALFAVAIAVTLGVYGIVGLIVKMDDVGLHLTARPNAFLQGLGRTLVLGMPKLLAGLSTIGIAAMLWVGGQIIVHGVNIHPAELLGLHGGALAWLVDAVLSGLFGLVLGVVIALLHHRWAARKGAHGKH